ncbi:MAG: hypothetical protein K8S25_08805 [Alphaproteobacteria bacterium]|nr:hypothetical protein [Alphaproteobacteria bacterium]
MKIFLAIYLGSINSARQAEWGKLDEAARQKRISAGMTAWGDWMTKHHASVVVEGGPLGKTKQASVAGISDTKNNMSGYVVVRAESHEAAASMFENHPHFSIFPGDSVEIMECLPISGR